MPFARPISDLDNTGAWATAPLFSKINEGGAGDGTVVASDSSPTVSEPFTVDLSTVADPAQSVGHILRIRWAKNASGGGNKTIRIELREGYTNEGSQGTLIATDDYGINSLTLRTDATTLSAGEANSITDYADLQIRVMGVNSNRSLKVDFVELETPGDPADHNQRAFRVRVTDPGINANGGGDWHAAENVDPSVDLDTMFRLRVEVEETEGTSDGGVTYKLQFRVNIQSGGYGSWVDVPVGLSVDTDPLGAVYPVDNIGGDEVITDHLGVMIIAGLRDDGAHFSNNAATTDILTTTSGSFVAGVGMHDNLSTSITLNAQHTELEWAILISRWWDGTTPPDDFARQYNDGDTFQFRVVESDSTLFTGDTNAGYDNIPEITMTDKPGHIGAVYIEEPDDVGPHVDRDGNVYFITEYGLNSNRMLLHKSTDGGVTWDEPTETGRPIVNDPEGASAFVDDDGDRLHIATHKGSDLINYHLYHMSSHPTTPDTWQTIDDEIDADGGNPVIGDAVSIVKRPNDNKIFVFYMGLAGGTSTIFYRDDDASGSWTSRLEVDTASVEFSGSHAVLGPISDDIYFFYMDQTNGEIFMRIIDSAGDTVGSRVSVASGVGTGNAENNTLRAVAYDDGGVEVVFITWHDRPGGDFNDFRTARNGTLQTAGIATDVGVERSGGGGHSGIADIAVLDKEVHIFYSTISDQDIWHARNDDEGGFGTDVERQDGVWCLYIRSGIWVNNGGNGGDTVLGYVWEDKGADGLCGGFIEFNTFVLAVGGGVTITAAAASATISAQTALPVLSALAVSASPSLLSAVASVVTPALAQLDVQAVSAPLTLQSSVADPVLSAKSTNVSPALLTIAAQNVQLALAQLDITASPALVSVLAQATVLALSALDVPVSPSLVSVSSQTALLALTQLDVQATPAPVTIAAQVVDPVISGADVNIQASPSLLTINAQVASAVLAALSISATPAPITVDGQAMDPVLSALAVSATPAALAVVAQVVQATLSALTVSATPAPLTIASQIVDPVKAALDITASPGPLTIQAAVTDPQVGTVNINADPATLSLSAATVSAVLSALAVPATPALLSLAAQAVDPVVGGGNIPATPAALTVGSQIVDPVLSALAINAASAAMTVLGQVVDPVQAALALQAVPAAMAIAAQTSQLSLNALDVQLTPVTIAVSGQIVNAVLANLIIAGSPAAMSVNAQAVTTVFSALAVQAVPSTLLLAASLMVPPSGVTTHFRTTSITQQGLRTSVTSPGHIVIIDRGA